MTTATARARPGRRTRTVLRWLGGVLAVVLIVQAVITGAPRDARAAGSFVPVSGSGSTWSSNALDAWRRNVEQQGMRINFAANGSSQGRNQFKQGIVDFAVSEIPYGLTDGRVVDDPPDRGYAYMPIVAGGTSFMYNLSIGGQRVTNLRLSGPVLAKIFTGTITHWNDPEIATDNPLLTLPAIRIVPVVRSDGSGTSAQFTAWMVAEQGDIWNDYCRRAGRDPCTQTSSYPTIPGAGFIGQSGSNGVSGYVSRAAGSITYLEYSYALNAGFPVAKVLNRSGYYIEPTAEAVAVGLLGAEINDNPASKDYLTQDLSNVYRNGDRRSYPLSSYSYMILPTTTDHGVTEAKGYTLGEFGKYFLCEGQRQAGPLGYSPLPINLVQAGFTQLEKIPGMENVSIDIADCNNPTFSPDGSNTLARNAPYPPECDRRGDSQCVTGTGGDDDETPANPPGGGGGGDATGGGGGGDATGGGGGGDATGGDGDATGGGDATGAAAGGETGADGGGDATGAAGDATGAAGDATGTAAGDATGTAAGGETGADAGAEAGAGAETGTDGGTVVDPVTGEVVAIGGDGGDGVTGTEGGASMVSAVPVSMAASSRWGFQQTLMVLAAALLLGVVIGPPLMSRVLTRTERRTS